LRGGGGGLYILASNLRRSINIGKKHGRIFFSV